jgi:hypothetical protein
MNLLRTLEGFYLWSYTTIYEIRPKVSPTTLILSIQIFILVVELNKERKKKKLTFHTMQNPPERIFFQLLAQVSPAAESFGKTFGLDLFTLYELAADQYLLKGDYGRALEFVFFISLKDIILSEFNIFVI